MSPAYDVIVVGLGAMGSAAARALARRGARVLGLDRFAPPHDSGSSHGGSRIIREAYFEDPIYVPLVQRAYLLWEELAREFGKPLLLTTGGLMIGAHESALVRGAVLSATEHGLPYERLEPAELRRRFPAFRPGEEMIGIWEPRAGVLAPEESIAAFLAGARRHGAELRTNEPALSWRQDGEGFEVRTARGRYRAEKLVLAAGAWMRPLLPDLDLPLVVERVVQYWFDPGETRERFEPHHCPISIWEPEGGPFFYAFPMIEGRVKAALHHEGEPVDPDVVRREVAADESDTLRAMLERYLPVGGGAPVEAKTCMYTNTPDEDFVIDRHPGHEGVVIVSACSGHGFKFAPAIGEAVSDLVVEGWTRWDLARFGIGRLVGAKAAPRR